VSNPSPGLTPPSTLWERRSRGKVVCRARSTRNGVCEVQLCGQFRVRVQPHGVICLEKERLFGFLMGFNEFLSASNESFRGHFYDDRGIHERFPGRHPAEQLQRELSNDLSP